MRGDPGKRLELAMKAKGFNTQQELADAIGVSQPTIWRLIHNKTKETRKLYLLCTILEVLPNWLLCRTGTNDKIESNAGLHKEIINSIVAGVTLRGTVKAGKWAEALEMPQEDQYQIPFDQNIFNEYPKDNVYALIVDGDSMDKEYKEGAYLYCISIECIGRKLTTGEHVIVERQHAGKYECTVKEIEFKQDKSVLLWPRSYNPDHQSPLIISDPTIANRSDHTIIRVTALVIGHFYRRSSNLERKM